MDNESVAPPRVLSFQLLNEITRDFSKDRIVGTGTYGEVYKGDHTNGEMIAVKVLHYIPGLDDEQFEKEYHNLASLQHKNIVRLVGYCHDTQREFIPYNGKVVLAETIRRALCFEYMQNGSLDSFLTDASSGLDCPARYKIIKGICQGLKYLHEEIDPPMYHLDLKPANILLDEEMVPKVTDFDLSRLFGGEKTQITKSAVGTHGYVPPEYIDAGIISSKFDIYSLGVVIIKIMTGPKGYFRSAEMSPREFIEQVHANWENRLQTTSVYPLEPHSKQINRCIEIALSCTDADRHKRPSIGVIISMLTETETAIVDVQDVIPNGTTSTLDESGRVQLVIRSNNKAPLVDYKKKMMLELTGGDCSSDRPGLDLVVVLDISDSIFGTSYEMTQQETAMRFVMQKLSPIDRLSVVTFSKTSTILCPLRQMTRDSKEELQRLIIHALKPFGRKSKIEKGLLAGLKVLADRKVTRGRIAGIMLASHRVLKLSSTRVTVGNVPVYTFGLGDNSDCRVLSKIAARSMGGTFSHVEDISRLTMAFSQCLAGLLTVSIQDIELTLAAVGDSSRILEVTAGSYPQTNDGKSATVTFSNLYSREVRKVIVELLLPAVESECNVEILKVTYSYSCSSSDRRLQLVAPPERLTVWRTGGELSVEMLPELQMEEVRLQTAKRIKRASGCLYGMDGLMCITKGELKSAQNILVEAKNMMDNVLEQPLLRTELQEIIERFKNHKTCLKHGHHYACSSESSHDRQRFAARGDTEIIRPFATPRMDMYFQQAKKFLKEPMTLLPSVEDDINEELGALSLNGASMEEEMRQLRLDVED